MKCSTIVTAVAILLLSVLTAIVSGERTVSGNKTPTTAEQKDLPLSSVSSPALTDDEITETASSTTATTADANAYEIPWQSINAGGDDMSSTNFQMSSSAGQSAIGYSTSANYQMGGGYWYGVTTTNGGCFCGGPPPAFGDVNCDEAVNPVDVVQMVNFVYKNVDNRCNDGWVCPYEPGDVNCDSAVNPVDVVRYVNYVYKNITPFPCDACA